MCTQRMDGMRRPTLSPPIRTGWGRLGGHSCLTTGLTVAASWQPARVMTQRTDSGGGRKRRARPTDTRVAHSGAKVSNLEPRTWSGPQGSAPAGLGVSLRVHGGLRGALHGCQMRRFAPVRVDGVRVGAAFAHSGEATPPPAGRMLGGGAAGARPRHAHAHSRHRASGWPNHTRVEAWQGPRLSFRQDGRALQGRRRGICPARGPWGTADEADSGSSSKWMGGGSTRAACGSRHAGGRDRTASRQLENCKDAARVGAGLLSQCGFIAIPTQFRQQNSWWKSFCCHLLDRGMTASQPERASFSAASWLTTATSEADQWLPCVMLASAGRQPVRVLVSGGAGG